MARPSRPIRGSSACRIPARKPTRSQSATPRSNTYGRALQLETGDFEAESPLGGGATVEAPADPRQLPAARTMRKRFDGALGKLAPDSAADAEKAWQRAKTISDLSKVTKRAEDLAKAAPPSEQPRAAPPAPAAPGCTGPARAENAAETGSHAGALGQDQPAYDGARQDPGERLRRSKVHDHSGRDVHGRP